jgi:hypothetical protein
VPRKHNSFEISRHGSFDESYTIPPALKNEPVVVRLVQDVQVKGVNVNSEPPLLKEGAIPEFLPVVEEPKSNVEVNPLADRDNYPGLLIRILGMFWGYPCK